MPRSIAATVNRCGAIGFHDVGAVGADLAGQVGAEHRRLAAHPLQQFVGIGQCGSGEHPGLHRTEAAQVAHHRAGVDARDADDALPDQFVLEGSGGPPVGRPRRRVAHGVTGDPDLVAAAFGVLVVPAGVADLRRGGDHDLAVIARVGQRLLVARHAGGEHRLAKRLADGAERGAGEDPAVVEDQNRLYSRRRPPPAIARTPRGRCRGTRCRSRCPTAAATGSPGCPGGSAPCRRSRVRCGSR